MYHWHLWAVGVRDLGNDRLTETETETENPVNRFFLANRNRSRLFVNRENRNRIETDFFEISKPKPKPEKSPVFSGYLPYNMTRKFHEIVNR